MAQQKVITSLVAVLAFACAANAGFAQTQATQPTEHRHRGRISLPPQWPRRQPIRCQSWLRNQQNNNWMDMLSDPEIGCRAPVDQSGQNERSAGFGDTVLAFACRVRFRRRLMVGAGPTFIPTHRRSLTRTLAAGPDGDGPEIGATLLGKNFIAYAFVQQCSQTG